MKHRAHVVAALAVTGLFAACGSSPTTPTPTSVPVTVSPVAGNYTWTIKPAATCVLGSSPDTGVVSYATAVPLTQDGNAISLSLTTMFSGMSLTGTVGSGGAVTFSIAVASVVYLPRLKPFDRTSPPQVGPSGARSSTTTKSAGNLLTRKVERATGIEPV